MNAPGRPSQVVGEALDKVVSVARAGAINVAGIAANGVLQFLLVVVISRGIGPRGAGVLYQAIALFTVASTAAQFGSDTGVLRMLPWYRARGSASEVRGMLSVAVWTVLAISTVIAAVTFVLAPQLADLFMRGVTTRAAILHIRLLTPVIPLATATLVMLAATRALGTMIPTVAVENVGKPAIRVILVLVAIMAGAGTVGVTVSWALPVVIGSAAALQIFRAMIRRDPPTGSLGRPGRPRRTLAVEFWRFSAPRGAAGILEITLGWLDILLLGAFRPVAEVGVYAAVSRTVVAALFILRAVSKAFEPAVSALLARDRRQQAQTLYQIATWWLMAASLPIFLTLAVFPRYLLQVFGPDFVLGHTALTVLALAMLINVGTGNVTAVLLMGGRSSWNLINALVALCLNVILNLILIPPLGMDGAAIAWGVSIVVNNLAALIEIRVLLRLEPFGAGYPLVALSSLVCFGLLGIAIRTALGSSTPSFILYVVASTTLYFLTLFQMRRQLELPILWRALHRQRVEKPKET
jgi:O-antigen/teichoic acid export membrane protein